MLDPQAGAALPRRDPRRRRQPPCAGILRRLPRPRAEGRCAAAPQRHDRLGADRNLERQFAQGSAGAICSTGSPSEARRGLPAGDQDRGRELSGRRAARGRLRRRCICGQKAYNGVAILSRTPISRRRARHPGLPGRSAALHRARRSMACASSACTRRTARRPAPTSTPTSCAGTRRCALDGELCAHAEARRARRLQRRARRSRRARSEALGRQDPRLRAERAALRKVLDAGLAMRFGCSRSRRNRLPGGTTACDAFERGWGLRIDLAMLSPELAKRCTGVHHRSRAAQARASFGSCAGRARPRYMIATEIGEGR